MEEFKFEMPADIIIPDEKEIAENVEIYEKTQAEVKEHERTEYLQSLIPPRYFEKIEQNMARTPDNEKQLEMILKWLTAYEHGKWLIITGNQGTGKTHVKNMIIKYLYDKKGKKCKAINFFNLNMKYLDSLKNGKIQSLFYEIINTKILIIDEIGRKKATEGIFDFMFAIIDHFYENKKTLILVGNLPATKDELGKFVDMDRIKECGLYVDFNGPSFRVEK